MPLAISPAAAASSRISPSRASSTPVTLVSRRTSRTPSPPLRSSEIGAALSVSRRTIEFAQQVDDRAGGRGVGVGRRGGGHHRIRRREPHRSGFLAAHHLPDVARQDHRVGVDSPQQPDRNQLWHRAIRGSTGCGVAGASQRRALQQPVQQLALRVVETVDQLGDLLRRSARRLRASPARRTRAGRRRRRSSAARRRHPRPAHVL